MRCPSCGAISKKRSMKCAECGAFRNRTWVNTEPTASPSEEATVQSAAPEKPQQKQAIKATPSLIEFPNPTRQTIPEWRKELGERVREVQERRAREAVLEGEALPELMNDELKSQRPLELLSKPSIPPTNPLVAAALRRIERAHTTSQFSGNAAVATAEAYDEQPAFDVEQADTSPEAFAMTAEEPLSIEETEVLTPREKTHKLTVVSAPVITTFEEDSVPTVEFPIEDSVTPVEIPLAPEIPKPTVKPKRLIRDNDPALNYLDSVPTTLMVENAQVRSAPIFFRMFSAVMDFIVVCVLAAPVVAMIKLTEMQWQNPRVIAFAASTVLVAIFLYLTMSIAFTGRTLAMRLFSLRVVDARTGLIPTGAQSAGRAVLYIISIAVAGLGLMYMFVDRERRTAHDRFTRTAVVRA
jgi:uncharacterized RDD family membrane protein YckC